MPAAPKPPAHPLAALISIGGMSLVLAAALEMLGFSQTIDVAVASWIKVRKDPTATAHAGTITAPKPHEGDSPAS